jgi:type II secretory pathway predicted ATPase ExeA
MFSHLTELIQAFGNTSNPQCLLRSHSHADALNLLAGLPEDGRNVRMLIGDPGMGKTILLLHLLEQFGDSALTAHLFWTQLGGDEFVRYFLHELGVFKPPDDIAPAQEQFRQLLQREFRQGRRVIVAIDEAHNLEIPALCGLAELLDDSLARSKELTVILAGLPQLAAKLASPEVHGIVDRISAIASLSPLTADETASYIHRKLEVSGCQGDGPFTSQALATIATLAEGIPRNINNICFAVLYLAEKQVRDVIDSAMVLEATAQWEGRLTAPTAQPAGPDQETSGCLQQHSSAKNPCRAADFDEDSVSTIAAEASVTDEGIAAVPASIRQWFGKQRVAWSGTVGELAAVLDQPETEVVHALHGNSEILRSFGIGISMSPAVGWTRSVSLRRLEGTMSTAEEANLGRSLPGEGFDRHPTLTSDSWPRDPQPNNGLMVQAESAPAETASVSAAEALDRLWPTPAEYFDEPQSSPSYWSVLAILMVLVIGLAWRYIPVLEQKGYFPRIEQQFTQIKKPSEVVMTGKNERRTVSDDANANTFSPRVQEPTGERGVPSVGDSTQTSSATNGIRPVPGEVTKSFQQAALSGDPQAQRELGTVYALGRGVPADPVIGYVWLTLSVLNGDQQAEPLIRELTPKLSSSEIARIRWNLGEMYANGVGVQPDKVAAYMWHLLAESAGETRSTGARSRLASTMTDGEKSEANARASEWLRKHQK